MKFCPECGTKIEGMKFCPECGYKIGQTKSFNNHSEVANVNQDNSDTEKIICTFQNKLLVGDANLKQRVVGNLDVKMPHKNYTLTNERLIIEDHGMIKSKREEIDLYRINDVTVKQGIIDKARNVGNLTLSSTDASAPICSIDCIENPQQIADAIKKASRQLKSKMNISYRQIL